jgi:hypothetical protein
VVLGYPPVGSSCIWVCLLNKCEISNIYCRAMTRVGIIEIIFNSDLKCLSVLSNVDRKYYQCIPKRGSRSDFKAEMYSWFIQRRGGTFASFLSIRKHYFFTLKTLLAPPNAPFDVEIE